MQNLLNRWMDLAKSYLSKDKVAKIQKSAIPQILPPMRNCPFCGQTGQFITNIHGNSTIEFVECGTCRASGPKFEVPMEAREDSFLLAINSWNARTFDAKQLEMLKALNAIAHTGLGYTRDFAAETLDKLGFDWR